MSTRVERKRLVALILGLALVVLLAAFAFGGDLGDPDISDDEVAVVEEAPDGTITQEDFQAGLDQAAFNLNLQKVPDEQDPEYEQVKQSALSNLIQTRWVRGEAEERGVTVTERDVDQARDQIIDQQLGGQKGYQDFIKSSPFDAQDVQDVAELSVLSSRLQEEALPQQPPVISDAEIEDYYAANKDQFSQPATRDVRQVVTKDEAEADRALSLLQQDDSPQSWAEVARRYSTDTATSGQGGLRKAVVPGQSDPAVDAQIFSTPLNEIAGPIKGTGGFYVFQPVKETPAETTPLADVRQQISQTLQQGAQSQAAERFRTGFISKWTARTFCGDDYRVDLCTNAEPLPDACASDDEKERENADPAVLDQGCEAFVLSRPAVNPGTGAVFVGQQAPALPQGPIGPAPAAGPLPPGLTPVGPGGAPAPPAGGAPPPPPGG